MNKFKNPLIIFLILSAIVQTNILWLQNISHHNFFYQIKETQKINHIHLAENFKMEIKNDKDLFAIIYKPNEQIKNITDNALKKIFEKGKFVSKTNFDFADEIKKSVCIYDYDFFITPEIFAAYLNEKSNNISQPKSFNKIFFRDDGQISFADTLENKIYRYKTENKFDFALLFQTETNYVYDKNLEPIINFQMPILNINNPYAQNGDLLMNTIEKKLDCFFNNSANKNIENVNNIFTFSDGSIIVKYYPENILEYTNYQSQDKSSDLLSDYVTAVNFIKKDATITNEYILKRYEENDGQTDFYFDYVINNLPIEIEKDAGKNIGLENFICISVKNGIVTKYKKLAFAFSSTNNYSDSGFKKYIYNGSDNFLSQF